MPLPWLKGSLALWKRRLAYRKAHHCKYHLPGVGASTLSEQERRDLAAKWHRLEVSAQRKVAQREQQIAARSRPRIITSAQLGLTFQYVWGAKGNVFRGAGHYTAGKRASNAAELAAEMRADHAFHKSKGWGGLSYEAMVADDGTIGFGNPIDRKSAAVASTNTGLVNICCPGSTGDRMTEAQTRSVRWLMDNWHTTRVPKAYRVPKRARGLAWHVHRDWPLQSTACPGVMKGDYEGIWR